MNAELRLYPDRLGKVPRTGAVESVQEAELRLEARISSSATASEGKQNLLCAYLAAALLVGLLGNALFGAWWLDPVVGLLIAGLAVQDGREAWRGDRLKRRPLPGARNDCPREHPRMDTARPRDHDRDLRGVRCGSAGGRPTRRRASARRFHPRLHRALPTPSNRPAGSGWRSWTVAALIAYLAMPIDLVPDFIPVAGQLDDAIVVAFVLRTVLRDGGPDLLREHWPGPDASLAIVSRSAYGRREQSSGAS